MSEWKLSLGATGGDFLVWAPKHDSLSIELQGKGVYPMEKREEGYFSLHIEEAKPRDLYYYQFADGRKRPDPVSRFLPEGPFGPTQIINPDQYLWKDQEWKGMPFEEFIFYELHVGLFSQEGKYEGVKKKLSYLKELGITCIELMPLTQFAGRCNWGYDGIALYAPHASYGKPEELKELIDLAHEFGIAVCLDVVYSHLGPTGNFLQEFAPYFRKDYQTKWGDTFNYDSPFSTQIRRMVIENALYWIVEYHIDCLRLDAIHGIYDTSLSHFLEELAIEVKLTGKKLGRSVHVMAESDENESAVVRSRKEGGYGIRGLWNEDFHHSLHTLLTNEQGGYYQDFKGASDLVKVFQRGFVYDNKYSLFRGRNHGSSAKGISWDHFVIFAQNHDQVGNRPWGDRLSTLITHTMTKVVPFFTLLTPAIPLLFMGEEYGEKAPFCYFVDFDDSLLMNAIFLGRKNELKAETMMVPSYESYKKCKLSWQKDEEILEIYRELLALRKRYPPKRNVIGEEGTLVWYDEKSSLFAWSYETEAGKIGVICYWGKEPLKEYTMPFQGEILLRSSVEVEWDFMPPESAFAILL